MIRRVRLVLRERPRLSDMLRFALAARVRLGWTQDVLPDPVEYDDGVVDAVADDGQESDEEHGVYLYVGQLP